MKTISKLLILTLAGLTIGCVTHSDKTAVRAEPNALKGDVLETKSIPSSALDRPLPDRELLTWATETVTQSLSLDSSHWRQQLRSMQSRYTPKTFSDLEAALKGSQILDLMKKNHLKITAANTRDATITATGLNAQGNHTWRLNFPVVLTYESPEGVINTQSLIADVAVNRVSVLGGNREFQISQLLMKSN